MLAPAERPPAWLLQQLANMLTAKAEHTERVLWTTLSFEVTSWLACATDEAISKDRHARPCN